MNQPDPPFFFVAPVRATVKAKALYVNNVAELKAALDLYGLLVTEPTMELNAVSMVTSVPVYATPVVPPNRYCLILTNDRPVCGTFTKEGDPSHD